MRLGLVTGLAREARHFRNLDLGPDHEALPRVALGARAGDAAAALAAEGADALLSVGYAGGLAPGIRAGDLILADAIVGRDGERIATDEDWRAWLSGLHGRTGAIAESDAVVATVEAKRAIHGRTGALAVDMESGATARAALARGLPFLAIRVVLDPWNRALPAAALAGVGDRGETRMAPLLATLARRPWEVVDLLRLAGDFRRADASLGRVGRAGAGLLPLGRLA